MLAKKELEYVPLIGWMWYFQEIVFCKRKWEEDRRTVAQSLQNLRDYPEKFWVQNTFTSITVDPHAHICCYKHASISRYYLHDSYEVAR